MPCTGHAAAGFFSSALRVGSVLYTAPMHNLESLAYKAERAASRRLAARDGHPLDEALRLTLEQAAGGAARLPALLESRLALQGAAQARMEARAARRSALLAAKAAARTGASTPWQGWFDGSAWPNPGRCGIGALITGPAQPRRRPRQQQRSGIPRPHRFTRSGARTRRLPHHHPRRQQGRDRRCRRHRACARARAGAPARAGPEFTETAAGRGAALDSPPPQRRRGRPVPAGTQNPYTNG